MAKLSAINKNKKRIKLSDRLYKKRQALKKIVIFTFQAIDCFLALLPLNASEISRLFGNEI